MPRLSSFCDSRIRVSKISPLFLRAPALGLVLDAGYGADDDAVVIRHRRRFDQTKIRLSVLPDKLEIVLLLDAPQAAIEKPIAFLHSAVVHEGEQVLPGHLLDRISEHLRHARIDEGGTRVGVDRPDSLLEHLDELAVSLLARAQRVLAAPSLGDIERGERHAVRRGLPRREAPS